MKDVGTLQELGVKAGDVVEYVFSPYKCIATKGYVATVNEFGKIDSECGLFIGNNGVTCEGATFRIVSRATPAPKLWRDMTPEEKGALLLAKYEGELIEANHGTSWVPSGVPKWYDDSYYRIKPEPKAEVVTLKGGKGNGWGFYENGGVFNNYRITFNLIYGKPDCASVKMECI